MTRYAIRQVGSDENIGPSYASLLEAQKEAVGLCLLVDVSTLQIVRIDEDGEGWGVESPARDVPPNRDPEEDS